MGDTKSNNNNNKRKRYFNHGNNKKQNVQHLFQDGMKGLLVTCNNREVEALKETYNIVQQYIDRLPVQEEKKLETDVDAAIKQEVIELTAKQGSKFRQVNTRCNNVIFVNIPEKQVDPLKLVHDLFKEVETSKGEVNARFVNRITPVETTCKATVESVTKSVEELLGEKNESEASFMVICKIRNNNDLKRMDFVESVADTVKQLRPKWTVNFTEPKIVLNIDIMIKAACLAFIPDYFSLKKYNILEYSSHLKQENTIHL